MSSYRYLICPHLRHGLAWTCGIAFQNCPHGVTEFDFRECSTFKEQEEKNNERL